MNGALAELTADLASLDDDDLVARFRALEAEARRLEASLAAVVHEVGRRQLQRVDGHVGMRGWLRARGWSDEQCTRRLRLGALVAAEPAVGDAMAAAELGVAQADDLARARANPRCGSQLGEFVPHFLREAQLLDHDLFSKLVSRWVTLADADGAHRSRDLTYATRRASVTKTSDVLHVSAFSGAVDAALMTEIFDRFCDAEYQTDLAEARAAWGDDATPAILARTPAQRRFDALRRIFVQAASTPPGARAPEPVVNFNCDVQTYLEHLVAIGWIEAGPGDIPQVPFQHRRCETTNGVPVTPADVHEAVLLGRVRRVLFDSRGRVVELGRTRRLFTGAAAEAVRIADPRCNHRGCGVRGRRCDIDHLREWHDGGVTDPDNGSLRCPPHHRAKDRGFRVWLDPEGHWHTYRPDGSEILP